MSPRWVLRVQVFVRVYSVVTSAARVAGRRRRGRRAVRVIRGERRCIVVGGRGVYNGGDFGCGWSRWRLMEAGALVCDAVSGSWQVKQATILLLASGRLMIRSVTGFEQLYLSHSRSYFGKGFWGQRYSVVRDESSICDERHSHQAQKCLEPNYGVGVSAIISLALDTDQRLKCRLMYHHVVGIIAPCLHVLFESMVESR